MNFFHISPVIIITNSSIFLDIILQRDAVTGEVVNKTYLKACAGNATILVDNCYPSYTIKAIPIGEFIRAWRNCSAEDIFMEKCDVISQRLQHSNLVHTEG